MQPAITDPPDDLAGRLDRLAEALRGAGVLADPAWRGALLAVPRHRFVPARAWIARRGRLVELDRDRDPASWWDAVASPDIAIITQLNDGAADPGPLPAAATSSCSAPSVQFELLNALDVRAGQRVLEIGTGTGWSAALLAHRLGDAAVTTVEVDAGIADQARAALAAAGHAPTVVTQDGGHGYPPAAPYDRILATCTVHTVPSAWIHQTRPGGIIVAPWAPPAAPGGGPLVRLTVGPDGTATGPFVANVSFMRLRRQRRHPQPPPTGPGAGQAGGATVSTTTVDPIALLFRSNDQAFPAQLALGEGSYSLASGPTPEGSVVWLSAPGHGSWARILSPVPFEATPPEGTRFEVEQHGPRRLWDDVEAAHRWWERSGRPGRLRFGLTVSPDGHTVWLDHPWQPVYLLSALPAPTLLAAPR